MLYPDRGIPSSSYPMSESDPSQSVETSSIAKNSGAVFHTILTRSIGIPLQGIVAPNVSADNPANVLDLNCHFCYGLQAGLTFPVGNELGRLPDPSLINYTAVTPDPDEINIIKKRIQKSYLTFESRIQIVQDDPMQYADFLRTAMLPSFDFVFLRGPNLIGNPDHTLGLIDAGLSLLKQTGMIVVTSKTQDEADVIRNSTLGEKIAVLGPLVNLPVTSIENEHYVTVLTPQAWALSQFAIN